MNKIKYNLTKKVKEIIYTAEETEVFDKAYFFYLDWRGRKNTDSDVVMTELIECHNGFNPHDIVSSMFPVFANVDRAIDEINKNYKKYKVIYIFNNAPIMADLFQRTVSLNNKGANIKLVNMNYELFAKYNMDDEKYFNGYLV